MSSRKLIEKKDYIVITALLLLAGMFYFTYHATDTAQDAAFCDVVDGGSVIAAVGLDKDQRFSIPEHPEVIFEVRDGAVAFIDSNCPDRTCVNTGFIRNPGQIAVCLPNKIMLKIRADGHVAEDSPDTVSY